jgi:hypothetical protein
MPIPASAADAQTIVDLLLRVYEIHERIIVKTGGLEGLEENIRRAEDESIQPKTISEIADWFRTLLGASHRK